MQYLLYKKDYWELTVDKLGDGSRITESLVGYITNFSFYSVWDDESLKNLEPSIVKS